MLHELGIQAYSALRHNKRRSILTMLGMAWGIATVVLLLAYGTGFERGLWAAFRSFGTNLVFVFPGRTSLQAGGTKAGSEVRLTIKDLDYIRDEVPLLKRLSPEVFKQSTVAWGTRSASYGVSGVYANYARMRRMEFAEGAPFGEAEDFTHARVAFMGADAKKKLFSGQNAIGESIRVDGISYQIVGVLKHVINNSDDNLNEHIYVPFSAMSDLKDTYYLNSIVMEYEGDNAKVVKALRNSMAFHHNFDPKDERAVFVFDVFSDLLDLRVITTGIKIMLGFIGLLTLGIGGVGLMNIMLVSVTQRTREIGVEKALGAHRWHILFPVPRGSHGHHGAGRIAGRGVCLPGLLVRPLADPVERISGRRRRRRYPPDYRCCHPHLVHRHSQSGGNRQRHAARHQSGEARSHRSPEIRVKLRTEIQELRSGTSDPGPQKSETRNPLQELETGFKSGGRGRPPHTRRIIG